MIEVLKQAYQLLLTEPHAPTVCDQLEVIFRRAIAELESQEPVAWMHQNEFTGKTTIFWDLGLATPNQNWKPLYTTPPQRTERNFCPRCGKRTNDIHTCTPPQDNT
jgi:hypothetical protein